MSNKNRKFRFNNKSSVQKRVVRHVRFDRHGHLINTVLKQENSLILERNLTDATNFTSSEVFEEVEEFVFKDEEFNEACENTVIVDGAGKEVNDDVKAEAHHQIVRQGTEDALYDVIENQDIEYTKESFIQRAKKNILDRFDFLRHNAEKDNEKTQEKSLLGRFKKKVKVYAGDILSMFENDKKSVKAYEQKITDRAPTVKAKVLWNKVKQHKYKIAAGFASVILLTACVTDTNKKAGEKKVNQTEKTVKVAQPAKPAPAPKQEAKADTVAVQTVYSDSLGISKVAWNRTKSYFGDKYELANKRLTDQIMKQNFDGLTRESVLNQIAYNMVTYEEGRIEKWERALNKGVKDDATQKIVNAYRLAQQLDSYLVGCNDQLPNNLGELFIDQVIDNSGRIVNTEVNRPDCGELVIKHKTISWKEAQEFVAEEKEEETPADTAATQKDFVLGGGSVEFKKKDQQDTTTVASNFTYNKSNEAYGEAAKLRDATADEVLGRQAKNKTIMVEVTGTDTSTKGSSATYNKGNNLNNGEVIRGATNEEAAAQKVAAKNIMLEQSDAQQNVAATQTGFKDLTGEKTDSVAAPTVAQTGFKDLTASADSAAPAAAQQTGFKDLTGEKTDSVAAQTDFKDLTASADNTAPAAATQTGFKDLTGEKKVEKVAAQKSAVADSTSYEVVAGTDGVEPGTPALESVAPRGGYNHTDVTKKVDDASRRILGDAYDIIIENVSARKDLTAAGGLLGGLTPEESAAVIAVRTQVFPYAKSTIALRKAVICGDTLSAEMFAQIKKDIEAINVNRTIDGVVYNQPRNTVSVKHNGCDEKETVNIETADASKVTYPSGSKFPRMFKVFQNVQQAFSIGGGSVEYLTLPQELVRKAAEFSYKKSNESFNNSMKLSDVDGSKVLGRQVKDKIIMVEVDGTSAPAQGVATYNKSNEAFGNSSMITTVPVENATGRKPKNKELQVEVTQQAIAQKKMNTQG